MMDLWKIEMRTDHHGTYLSRIISNLKNIRGRPIPICSFVNQRFREDKYANAHLIAAAPDLFRALECLMSLTLDSTAERKATERYAREALAKARGEIYDPE
ncbi:MAG: hypothetical protein VW498_02160 [Candidatus Thalassarchaeaceae archaeon]